MGASRLSSLIEIPCRAVPATRPPSDWMASTPISIPKVVISMPYASREQQIAYFRRYRQTHKEQKAQERPTHDRVSHANKRAQMAGDPGQITVTDVRAILTPDARCHYCGRSRSEVPPFRGKEILGIDHVIPLHVGGPNTVENIVPCCHSCNASKHRSDRPGRWSREQDQCVGCGTTERKHITHGLCTTCYSRSRRYRLRKGVHANDY